MAEMWGVRGEFSALVSHDIDEDRISLERAALTIARLEYRQLQANHYIELLDQLGERVDAILPAAPESSNYIAALNRILFQEEAFRGNQDDYYDPRNSFLNDVLDRRLGIPITLALVYMEVGRRVGFPLFGVGLPGHFLLKHYEVDGRAILIDAFNGGDVLDASDCQARLDAIYSGQVTFQPEFLQTVSPRQMLTRMLNNLRGIYISSRNLKQAALTVDLILALHPRSAEDMKQRGLLRLASGQLRAAADDLENYVRMTPESSDADEIRQTALSIRRKLASLN
jgi:regulator of sirC expression with transglutaminase-like and TPR domain